MLDLTVGVPIILGVVQALKVAGLKSKYAPITAIALGVAGFYFFSDGEVANRVVEGLVSSLSAMGLYSGAKATIEK